MGSYHTDYVEFTKMHGAGNDYIYVDATINIPENPERLAIDVSNRHFGIGGDGLVMILKSDVADFRMRMFNADGSEAQMCGNATRCIGKYVYEHAMTDKRELTLETLAGIKVLNLHVDARGRVNEVTVDMGVPTFLPDEIPVEASIYDAESKVAKVEMEYAGEKFEAIAVSMGNPHAVIFIETAPSGYHVLEVGKSFENHCAWPEKTNVEFAHILNRNEIEMRVWERGTGETLACGTGACATAVAAMLTGRTDKDVYVHLPGGDLRIRWDKESGHVYMTGPASTIAEGRYFLSHKRDKE